VQRAFGYTVLPYSLRWPFYEDTAMSTNENTNRRLRQYFPKGTDLSVFSQADLNKVARKLNQRPRKTLGYKTPADKLQASVASIS